jgi:hypothetical protein
MFHREDGNEFDLQNEMTAIGRLPERLLKRSYAAQSIPLKFKSHSRELFLKLSPFAIRSQFSILS